MPLAISDEARSACWEAKVACAPSSATPKSAIAICEKVCSVVLTVIAAAASSSLRPLCIKWRVISTGPPS